MANLESEALLAETCALPATLSPGEQLAKSQILRDAGSRRKHADRRAARETERDLIGGALDTTRWNRTEAARQLRISYKALLYKMRVCGL